jgi:hypothetical protein
MPLVVAHFNPRGQHLRQRSVGVNRTSHLQWWNQTWMNINTQRQTWAGLDIGSDFDLGRQWETFLPESTEGKLGLKYGTYRVSH